jgi:hypothetical protein
MNNLTKLQRELCRLRDESFTLANENTATKSFRDTHRTAAYTYQHAAELVAELKRTFKAARDNYVPMTAGEIATMGKYELALNSHKRSCDRILGEEDN